MCSVWDEPVPLMTLQACIYSTVQLTCSPCFSPRPQLHANQSPSQQPGCDSRKVTVRSRTVLGNRTSLSFTGCKTQWQDVPFMNVGKTTVLKCMVVDIQGCPCDLGMERRDREHGSFYLKCIYCLFVDFEGRGQVLNQS